MSSCLTQSSLVSSCCSHKRIARADTSKTAEVDAAILLVTPTETVVVATAEMAAFTFAVFAADAVALDAMSMTATPRLMRTVTTPVTLTRDGAALVLRMRLDDAVTVAAADAAAEAD